MGSVPSLHTTWIPESDRERQAIREHLDRMLASPLFKNSRRYPGLLRFVVERSLQGFREPLKERTLGIEVFGRNPDYDTNMDPVVRTTAVEIRKRIARYYDDPTHANEIRIDLPAGSYTPEFHLPTPVPLENPPSPESLVVLPAESPKSTRIWRAGIIVLLFVAAAGVATAGVYVTRSFSGRGQPIDT